MLGLDRLELDRNLLAGNDVRAQVDVSEGTRPDFTANTVFITDAKILLNMLVSVEFGGNVVDSAGFAAVIGRQ